MRAVALTLGLLLGTPAAAQTAERVPHIGYLFPAGAQRGTTVEVTAGGQWLAGADRAWISGDGLTVRIVEVVQPLGLGQIYETIRYYIEMLQYRRTLETNPEAMPPEKPEIPDHPLFRGLDELTADDLNKLRAWLTDPKRQPNPAIAQQVLLEVTVEPDATPGPREIRLVTAGGLTNPMVFDVGRLREVSETEGWREVSTTTVLDALPAVVNGQIMPGDRDRIRFTGRRGQRLVVEAQARRLIPYLADAVPGWFQAVLALYDSAGNEVAFVDDFRFDPDPLLAVVLPELGEYELEIRDSIYRGREDFVYRVSLGELPVVTSLFPLGGTQGQPLRASLSGWNLLEDRPDLDTSPGGGWLRFASLDGGVGPAVPYAVDTLPEMTEGEPNDTGRAVTPPIIINGRIGKPGDLDRFTFTGRAGETVAAEVLARRLRSPLDSLLRLIGPDGAVVAWNDDQDDRAFGLMTHVADSYLTATLPADGAYRLEITDAQAHGGDDHAYRLRLSPPRHDFALRLEPATINVEAGRVALLEAYAIRRDGFAGPIDLRLVDAPAGFELSGGRIPAGADRVKLTVTAPPEVSPEPIVLRLEGSAEVNGELVTRPAAPVEEQMQAFLWTHLVPMREMVTMVRPAAITAPAGRIAEPLRLPLGGVASATVLLPTPPNITNVEFALLDAPAGVTLGVVNTVPEGLRLELKADATAKSGAAGNLIVEVHLGGRRGYLGLVPAIPFEVTEP